MDEALKDLCLVAFAILMLGIGYEFAPKDDAKNNKGHLSVTSVAGHQK